MARKTLTTKKGPEPISEARFIELLAENLGDFEYVGGPNGARMWLREFKKTVEQCVVRGERVNLVGLLKVEPKYVPAKMKGELVRNPATGETAPRPTTIPASFKVKATASASLKRSFPTTRTAAGKALAEKLGG